MPTPAHAPRNVLIAGCLLLLIAVLGATGWHAYRSRHGPGCRASYERHIEALDDLRATGAISDAEYDVRMKQLRDDVSGKGSMPLEQDSEATRCML